VLQAYRKFRAIAIRRNGRQFRKDYRRPRERENLLAFDNRPELIDHLPDEIVITGSSKIAEMI
jgi:hypothetical protein